MKNKKLFLVASMFAIVSLVACGKGSSSNVPSTSSNPDSSETSANSDANSKDESGYTYKVKVLLPDGKPAAGVKVQWCTDSTCLLPVSVDANGVASMNMQEAGEYSIHLLSVPQGYAYNPNIYTQNGENLDLTITLDKVEAPSKGDGKKYDETSDFSGGPFIIKEGVYANTVKADNGENFFAFNPSKPGNYVIESWASQSVADKNEADPKVGYYCKGLGYIPALPLEEDDNSGVGDNFSLKFEVAPDSFKEEVKFDAEGNATVVVDENNDPVLAKDENGNYIPDAEFVFGLSAKKAGSYNFRVYYESEYVDTRVKATKVKVSETLTQYPDNEDDRRVRYLELDGSDKAVYNDKDHFYHLGNADGDVILCNIAGQLDALFTPISEMPEMGNPYVLANGTKDYKDFVAQYARMSNDEGLYPLTKELKLFLEELIEAQDYFGEWGFVSSWYLEQHPGYEINKDYQFMFACGVYLPVDGVADNPRQLFVTDSSIEAAKVKEGSSVYYQFACKSDETVYITSDDANARFIYNGVNYDGGSLTIDAQARTIYNFQVTTKDGSAGYIYFTIGTVDPSTLGPQLGINYVTVDAFGATINFVPSAPGNYTIGTSDPNACIDFFTGDFYGPNYEEESLLCSWDGTGSIEFIVMLDTMDFFAEAQEVSYYIYDENGEGPGTGGEEGGPFEAKVGTNTISVTAGGSEVAFIAPEDGTYAIGTEDPNAGVDNYGASYGPNYEYGSFNVGLHQGEEARFFVFQDTFDFSAPAMDVTFYITKISDEVEDNPLGPGEQGGNFIAQLGNNTINVTGAGSQAEFTALEDGTYAIGTEDPNAGVDNYGDFYGPNYEENAFEVGLYAGDSVMFYVFQDTMDFSAPAMDVTFYITKVSDEVKENGGEGGDSDFIFAEIGDNTVYAIYGDYVEVTFMPWEAGTYEIGTDDPNCEVIDLMSFVSYSVGGVDGNSFEVEAEAFEQIILWISYVPSAGVYEGNVTYYVHAL